MAGALIRVLGKTYFDYSTLAASTTSERIVAAGINVSAYREGVLIVRLHALSEPASGSGWSAVIEAWADAPSEEDTGARWVEPLGTVLASATVGPGSSQLNAAEEFAKMSLSAGFGGWIKVLLKVTQGSTAASPLAFTISVDLSVKE